MLVLDLACDADHRFEAWLASHAAFHDQLARGLLSCPICGSVQLRKLLSAPRLNLSKQDQPEKSTANALNETHSPAAPNAGAVMKPDPQRMLARLAEALAQAEDVGNAFADEARKIHHGDAPDRPIRGESAVDEVLALLEEGVPVLPLPGLVPGKDQLH